MRAGRWPEASSNRQLRPAPGRRHGRSPHRCVATLCNTIPGNWRPHLPDAAQALACDRRLATVGAMPPPRASPVPFTARLTRYWRNGCNATSTSSSPGSLRASDGSRGGHLRRGGRAGGWPTSVAHFRRRRQLPAPPRPPNSCHSADREVAAAHRPSGARNRIRSS